MKTATKSNKKIDHYYSVIDFVNSARGNYDFSLGKDEGFIQFMKNKNKFYMLDEKSFIPYFKEYLNN